MVNVAHGDAFGKTQPGNKNILADQLICPDQALPTEWSLSQACNAVCKVCSHPHIVLFATSADTKLPLYVYLVLGPLVRNEDAFQLSWVDLVAYAFPPLLFLDWSC